jgi:ribonuclease-3
LPEALDFTLAREDLRARIARIVGEGEIPRFDEALTHTSYANESKSRDNQRLEFLGDAVLGLCVSELLVAAHPDADEGTLTRMRAALVNAEALARWGREMDLGAALALGKGARAGTEREQANVISDAVEALVAAVYEAFGIDGARALVREVVKKAMDQTESLASRDPKSLLQERVQAQGRNAPLYRVVSTSGPPHAQMFVVECLVDEEVIGRGEGRSKRLAEREAAAEALRRAGESAEKP